MPYLIETEKLIYPFYGYLVLPFILEIVTKLRDFYPIKYRMIMINSINKQQFKGCKIDLNKSEITQIHT